MFSIKIGVTKLNYILLNIMPNIWSKQAYVQGFDCEYITFKKAINMFESIYISESFYEGVVEPSYKKPTRKTPTVLVTAGKREENPPCHGLAPRMVRSLVSAEKDM